MIEFKYLSLDYISIVEAYPKAVQKVRDWLGNRRDIIEAFDREKVDPNKRDSIISNMVSMIIQHDPRKLYDVFDDYNVIICGKIEVDGLFRYWIGDYNNGHVATGRKRIDTEAIILEAAFEVLEKQS